VSTALLDRSRVEIKLADYGTAPATALDDGQLLGRVQDYRRGTAARLYPLEGSEIVQKIPAAEFHVSRKLDGEFTVLVFRQGEAFTLNPGGTVRVGLPFLEEAASLLSKAGVKEAMIAGELYVAREDRRTRVHDIVSMAGKPASVADLESIHFGAFEIISLNGSPPPAEFRDSWGQLTKLLQSGHRIRPVEASWVNKADAIRDLYAQWVEKEGAEGLVVRSTAAGSFKIKPRHNLDVAVVGFAESAGDRTGLLHDMLVAVLRREGTFHVLGRVGGGFTDEQRKEMLSDLKDMVVHSEYAEVSADHVAYQMVKPEWVIEISCLDLVAQNTRGGPVNRMVLDWHANNGHSFYKTLRRLPLASVISPQFVRRRDDKQVQPTDVRIAQVANLVELPHAEKDSRQMLLPKSEILRREVYVKELKGETMIRKLLMWKTNKEQVADDFPAYVVHLTDFSPNRKDPLSREMRISSSFEQIQQLFDGLKTENITKGWNLHAKTESGPKEVPAPLVVAAPIEVRAPVAAEPTVVEAEPVPTKKKATRKFAESETEAPAKPKAPRKKKSG
jgi:hypothetical protein